MDVEWRGHPANWLHEELFSLPDETPIIDDWWNGFNEVLRDVRDLSDNRSVASVCFSMAVVLLARSDANPNDAATVDAILHDELIPLWEREIEKKDNWMHIADNVWEFSSIVGGDIGQKKVIWGADMLQKLLPRYDQIPSMYPDEMIANGIEAVMLGKSGWYGHMANLYKFCDIGNDVSKILLLCEQNSWHQEAQAWNYIRNYFYNLLLNIDLSLVDPRLVETMYDYLSKNEVDKSIFTEITKHVSAWKYARSHVNGKNQDQKNNLM